MGVGSPAPAARQRCETWHDMGSHDRPSTLRIERPQALSVLPSPAPFPFETRQSDAQPGPLVVVRKRRHVSLQCETPAPRPEPSDELVRVPRVHRVPRPERLPVELHDAHVRAFLGRESAAAPQRPVHPERRASRAVAVQMSPAPGPLPEVLSQEAQRPSQAPPGGSEGRARRPRAIRPSVVPETHDLVASPEFLSVKARLARLRKVLDDIDTARALMNDLDAFLTA